MKITKQQLRQIIKEEVKSKSRSAQESALLEKLGFEFGKYGWSGWTKTLPRPWMADIYVGFDQKKGMWSLSVGSYEDSVLEIEDVSLRALLSMYNKLISDITIG